MVIRKEKESDIEEIFEVTKKAFENHPYSNNTEQFIVNALRTANALTISLVAEIEGKVVGHIAFSSATISDGSLNWYILGPISVLPEFQKQGIGKSLIYEGISSLKSLGAQGCVLVGEPDYYTRFGFRSFSDLIMEGVPQENVLALPFDKKRAQGNIVHHQAFFAES
ncbi:GNAT family N-acetyltransferase [Candidatus Latescibacterota bacterium]